MLLPASVDDYVSPESPIRVVDLVFTSGDIPELLPQLHSERFQADQAALLFRYRWSARWSSSARAKFVSESDGSIFDLDGSVGNTLDLTGTAVFKNFTLSATVLNVLVQQPLPGHLVAGRDSEPSLLLLLRHRGGPKE